MKLSFKSSQFPHSFSRLRECVFLLAMIFVCFPVVAQERENQKANLDEVLANVGELLITRNDTQFWIFQIRTAQPDMKQTPDEFLIPYVLQDMIEEHLLYEQFWSDEAEATEEELKKMLEESFALRVEEFGSQVRLESELRYNQLRLSDYRQWLEERLKRDFVIQQGLLARIDLDTPDASVSSANPTISRVELREIFIAAKPNSSINRDQSITEEEWKIAEQRALRVQIALSENISFSEVARLYSDSSLTADNGGYLGWAEMSLLAPEIQEALKKTRPGTKTSPIRLETGYSIFFLENVETNVSQEYRETRERVRARIVEDIWSENDVSILPRYDLTAKKGQSER